MNFFPKKKLWLKLMRLEATKFGEELMAINHKINMWTLNWGAINADPELHSIQDPNV